MLKPKFFRYHARATLAAASGVAIAQQTDPSQPILRGKAEHVISIWLGGGMGQIDTFDPKRKGDRRRSCRARITIRFPLVSKVFRYVSIFPFGAVDGPGYGGSNGSS